MSRDRSVRATGKRGGRIEEIEEKEWASGFVFSLSMILRSCDRS